MRGLSLAPAEYFGNTFSGNSYGIGIAGNDATTARNTAIYLNKITTEDSAIRFGMSIYSGENTDFDIYCNQITNTGTSGYPFYFNGTLSDILIDHNQITNSNAGGYEAWVDADESTDILFYGNGQIDVTGGGAVGTAVAATNGSAGCYLTAGANFIYTPPSTTRRLFRNVRVGEVEP